MEYRAQAPTCTLRPRIPCAAQNGKAISYLPPNRDRVGLTYTYRFSVMRYSDLQPVRSASQSLSVGAVVRFGATRRHEASALDCPRDRTRTRRLR